MGTDAATSAGPKRSPQLSARGLGVRQEVQHEARQSDVEGVVGNLDGLSVHAPYGGIGEAAPLDLEAEQPDHLLGEVDARHLRGSTHSDGGREQRRTSPRADVEHRLALPESRDVDEPGPEVSEEGDDRVLGRGGAAEHPGDLFGVVVHD